MSEEILINVTPQETRVAVLEQGVTQELHVERASARGLVGNIYLGKVGRVLPVMFPAEDPKKLAAWTTKFGRLLTSSIYKWVQTPLSLHVGNLDLDRERALQLPVVQRREWDDLGSCASCTEASAVDRPLRTSGDRVAAFPEQH